MKIKDLLYAVVSASTQFGPPVAVEPYTRVSRMYWNREGMGTYRVGWVAERVPDRRLRTAELEACLCVRITTRQQMLDGKHRM